jgi:hypothetical protein
MIKWYAIYEDDPRREMLVEKGKLRADALKRFEDARTANAIYGRETRGMWMIDDTTEQEDVIKRHGSVPGNISIRFVERKRRIAGAYPNE